MAHSSREQLMQQLLTVEIKPGQRYQHYKTKGIYIVEKLVILEATEEPAVAYHDEEYPQLTWIRSYHDFTANIDSQARFSLLS